MNLLVWLWDGSYASNMLFDSLISNWFIIAFKLVFPFLISPPPFSLSLSFCCNLGGGIRNVRDCDPATSFLIIKGHARKRRILKDRSSVNAEFQWYKKNIHPHRNRNLKKKKKSNENPIKWDRKRMNGKSIDPVKNEPWVPGHAICSSRDLN